MKIALYGYGKMGKAIEAAAIARGHAVVARVDHHNAGTPPAGADVAIEFSTPATVMQNVQLCLDHHVPVVVGTTGWYGHMREMERKVKAGQGAVLWASNFSIGVNLFFKLNQYLAGLMAGQPDYAATIEEIHHIHKLDAPSGTAISLAKGILEQHERYGGWELAELGKKPLAGRIPVHSKRTGEVPGTHTVCWESAQDRISITHEAFGRQGFATGAVVAAEWLRGRQGFFNMEDVLAVPNGK
ncbi:MAG: 4-hydroxy-tetrahydrodipicolinate reductase [Bacteroidetes bacterium]|nr:4-hydroxy-tetrahydrodipicolinate reductase [Bacteroidota bacterium]